MQALRTLCGLALFTFFCAVAADAQMAKDAAPPAQFNLGKVLFGDGRTTAADFKGSPVVFAQWQDIYSGMDAARKAVGLAEKHAKDGLVVVLVSTKAFDEEGGWAKAVAFLEKNFPNHKCRVVGNIALPMVGSPDTTPPMMSVVGVDGTVQVAGSARTIGGKVDNAVAAELEKKKKGWGKDANAKKIRALCFNSCKFNDAYNVGMSIMSDDPEVTAAMGELLQAFRTSVAIVKSQMAEGRPSDAKAEFDHLREAIKGHKELNQELAPLVQEMESEATTNELALEKKLKPMIAKLAGAKADASAAKGFEKFATENAGTKVGERAKVYAEIAAAMTKL